MTGLEYFAFEANYDRTTRLLTAKFGACGIGILTLLLKSIYGDMGYYMVWNDESRLLFGDEADIADNVVNACVGWNVFDREKFDKYSILTSAEIQSRYAEGIKRRKRVEFINEYLLTDVTDNGERANVFIVSAQCQHNVDTMLTSCQQDVEQGQVKEKKRNEKKVNENNNKENKESDEVVAVVDTPKGVYKEVYGTDEPAIESSLTKYLTKMDRELLIHVLTQAKADSKPWSWVTAVLDNHLKQGTRTLAEFKEKSKAHLGSSPPKNKFTDYTEQGNYDIEAMERRNLEKRMASIRNKSG